MSDPCRWCGQLHTAICPRIKSIEFADDGETIRRVEFMTPRDNMPANGWQLSQVGPAIAGPFRRSVMGCPHPICAAVPAIDFQTRLQNSANLNVQ